MRDDPHERPAAVGGYVGLVCAPSQLACNATGCMHVRSDWLAEPVQEQRAACEREQRCVAYAARLALGVGVARDLDAAHAAFASGCAAKDALACVDAARAERAPFERFRAMCDEGMGEACLEAGNAIRFGDAAKTHTPLDGAKLYERACDRGVAAACTRLGFHYGTGLGVTRDDRRAYELMSHACACHENAGCSGVGYLLRDGRGVVQDLTRARAIFEDLCSRKVYGACVFLATMYKKGEGLPVDLARAHELYTRACDARREEPEGAQGCVELGEAYRDADGVARDERRALELFDEACKLQVATGCADLGQMYRDGQAVTKDVTRARSLFQTACDHGDDSACKQRDALR